MFRRLENTQRDPNDLSLGKSEATKVSTIYLEEVVERFSNKPRDL